MLFVQDVFRACSLALERAGSNIPARIAMMAITTSNSIKVNPVRLDVLWRERGELQLSSFPTATSMQKIFLIRYPFFQTDPRALGEKVLELQ